jgi:hypothetical protein
MIFLQNKTRIKEPRQAEAGYQARCYQLPEQQADYFSLFDQKDQSSEQSRKSSDCA